MKRSVPSTESIRLWTSISWTVKSITINRSAKVAVWHKDTKQTTYMHTYYHIINSPACLPAYPVAGLRKKERTPSLLIIPLFDFGQSKANSGAHSIRSDAFLNSCRLKLSCSPKGNSNVMQKRIDRTPGYVKKSSNLSFLNRIGRTMQADACAHLAQCGR